MRARLAAARAQAVAALTPALQLLPWWRHRLCERGLQTCWECASTQRLMRLARGGASREEWRAMRASVDEATDTLSRLAAVALHPDRERLVTGLSPAELAAIEKAAAAYTPREPVEVS